MDIEVMGQTFWLNGIKGTVKDVRKWTSTTVQSTGQGTITDLGYGVYRTSAPQIFSTTQEHQDFWIVSPGGRQEKVEVNGDIGNGQTVLVVWGSVKGNNNGYNLVVRNFTTNQGWNLFRCLPNSIAYKGTKELTLKYLGYIFVPLIILTLAYSNLPPRNNNLGGVYHSDRDYRATHPTFTQSDIRPFLNIDIFMAIPILIFVGYRKRTKLIWQNYNTAMVCINQAINNNPQFVKSLES